MTKIFFITYAKSPKTGQKKHYGITGGKTFKDVSL
jgi:hypothetical protein